MPTTKFYDIFDPNCYNNVFVLAYSDDPIIMAGCYVPTSPDRRSLKVKSFYNWLSYVFTVETNDKWSLHSCDITPGPFPFSISIDSPVREPIDRDSENYVIPGAYLILDGTNSSPVVARRGVNSRHLNLLKRGLEIDPAPPSIPPSAFCNITGTTLNDESRRLVQIIRNTNPETLLIFLLGPWAALPGLDTAQNFLTMTPSLQSHFDSYAFGIDVDDNYRIVQFTRPTPDFDLFDAGTLKIPEGEKMPYDECLKLHFNFCLQIYVSSPPPGVQTYALEDIEGLQEDVGMYERDETLPDLTDPIWNSPLGREVLRAAMAWRLSR